MQSTSRAAEEVVAPRTWDSPQPLGGGENRRGPPQMQNGAGAAFSCHVCLTGLIAGIRGELMRGN